MNPADVRYASVSDEDIDKKPYTLFMYGLFVGLIPSFLSVFFLWEKKKVIRVVRIDEDADCRCLF